MSTTCIMRKTFEDLYTYTYAMQYINVYISYMDGLVGLFSCV